MKTTPTRLIAIALLSLAAAAPPARSGEPEKDGKVWRLPSSSLFEPPLADPRQPRFYAAFQRYDVPFGEYNVASVALGGDLGLVRIGDPAHEGAWQLGLSGAVLALFNLDGSSNDLLNADYYVGIPVSWRRGPVSARVRLYHLSSHLGDEYLLNPQPGPPMERENLSYEALEALGAWEQGPWRLYGGGSRIVHSVTPLRRNRLQAGVEFRSHRPLLLHGHGVAALDVQAWDETGWDRDVSVRVGLALPDDRRTGRALMILLEYYDGHLTHGQFYPLETRYVGLGLVFHH